MNKQRPVNLDLMTIKFPLPAIASILHRISGLLLFFAVPCLLWLLQDSLSSASDFNHIKHLFAQPVLKILLLSGMAALLYHLIAGIRHLLMDVGIGESFAAGKRSVAIVIVLTLLLTIIIGIRIW